MTESIPSHNRKYKTRVEVYVGNKENLTNAKSFKVQAPGPFLLLYFYTYYSGK